MAKATKTADPHLARVTLIDPENFNERARSNVVAWLARTCSRAGGWSVSRRV